MKNVFADVSGLAARAVSPRNMSYEQVAPDTKPSVSAYLRTLDRGLSPQPAGM